MNEERIRAVAELVAAVQAGDLSTVRALLDRQRELDSGEDENGVGVLLVALYHRQQQVAEVLAAAREQRGASLDLLEAAALGRAEVVAATLAADAGGLQARSADGFTALHYACFFARPEAARVLIEHGAQVGLPADNPTAVQPLHSAAAAGANEICSMLLERGADVDARQHGGFTALMAAAMGGNDALVDLLLEHGADPRLCSDDGKTAAQLAMERGHERLATRFGPPEVASTNEPVPS